MKRKDGERGAALLRGDAEYFTGRPCRRGHSANRWTASGHCKTCALENTRTPEWVLYRRQYFLNNRGKTLEQSKEYYEAHKPHVLARTAAWQAKNTDKTKVYRRRWHQANPVKVRAKVCRYRAQKLSAMPVWVNGAEIENVYRECRRRTQEAGIAHHVDHIVPLKNKKVCGLHVPWNLQIITASENVRKRNKFAA